MLFEHSFVLRFFLCFMFSSLSTFVNSITLKKFDELLPQLLEVINSYRTITGDCVACHYDATSLAWFL